MQKPFKSKKVFWKNFYWGMRQGIGQEAVGGKREWAVKKKASPPREGDWQWCGLLVCLIGFLMRHVTLSRA